jgi:hypothetical protein
MTGSRVLPENELSAKKRELEGVVAEAQARIANAEIAIQDASIQLRLIDSLMLKVVPVAPLLNGNVPSTGVAGVVPDEDDDDETEVASPTRAIMDLLTARPGLTRDEIFGIVAPRLNTRSNDKRTLVVNILRRLVTKYGRLEEQDGRYYLTGQAPPRVVVEANPYEEFQSPYDDDDDLPF